MQMGCSMAAKKNEHMYMGPEQTLLRIMNVNDKDEDVGAADRRELYSLSYL